MAGSGRVLTRGLCKQLQSARTGRLSVVLLEGWQASPLVRGPHAVVPRAEQPGSPKLAEQGRWGVWGGPGQTPALTPPPPSQEILMQLVGRGAFCTPALPRWHQRCQGWPCHGSRPLTVSFFLLKTGMATVVSSVKLCAWALKSCGGGQRTEAQRAQCGGPIVAFQWEEAVPNGSSLLCRGRPGRSGRGEVGWAGARPRSRSQGESQHPGARGPAAEQAHWALLSRMSARP